MIITNWLTDHTADEIIAAFDDFFAQMGCNEYGVENEFEIRHAARNFCEKGLHLIEYARRQEKEDAEREEELAARKRVQQLMQETQKPQADEPDTN